MRWNWGERLHALPPLGGGGIQIRCSERLPCETDVLPWRRHLANAAEDAARSHWSKLECPLKLLRPEVERLATASLSTKSFHHFGPASGQVLIFTG